MTSRVEHHIESIGAREVVLAVVGGFDGTWAEIRDWRQAILTFSLVGCRPPKRCNGLAQAIEVEERGNLTPRSSGP